MKRGDTDSSRSDHNYSLGNSVFQQFGKNFLSSGSNKDHLVKYYSGFCKKTLFLS